MAVSASQTTFEDFQQRSSNPGTMSVFHRPEMTWWMTDGTEVGVRSNKIVRAGGGLVAGSAFTPRIAIFHSDPK